MLEGLFTLEQYARKRKITLGSALNELTQLKKKGYVVVSGGGRQKRLYRVSPTKITVDNGLYSYVNKYSPEKLVPQFIHKVYGKYSVEHAIIDAIQLNDARTNEAILHLFRHVKNWKRLFDLARLKGLVQEVLDLYDLARTVTKVRKIPRRYL